MAEFETRTIVVGVVLNRSRKLLLCKMAPDRGVFPGQWGLPGGGVEPNEKIENALRRELIEEIGIEVTDIEPAFFKDKQLTKTFKDGSKRSIYMIFLIFYCVATTEELILNPEFVEYKWVRKDEIREFDLNAETIDTLEKIDVW